MPFGIDGGLYARVYGPTTGGRVRPGDTNLLVEVERDDGSPGDETLWGLGKTLRSMRTCSGPFWYSRSGPDRLAGGDRSQGDEAV